MRNTTLGLTFVEVLVATLLGLIVMAAALRLVVSSRDLTTTTINQDSTTEDLQATLALIADDVRRAAVIHDSLSAPTWISSLTGVTRSLTLTLPATSGCTVPQVTYAVMPRTNLTGTGVNTWLRLTAETDNTTQSAIVRAERCGTLLGTLTPTYRLVADYLESAEFALARVGEITFSTSPTSATGGVPYQSVRIEVASSRTQQGRTARVPASGTLTTVASSRVVE